MLACNDTHMTRYRLKMKAPVVDTTMINMKNSDQYSEDQLIF